MHCLKNTNHIKSPGIPSLVFSFLFCNRLVPSPLSEFLSGNIHHCAVREGFLLYPLNRGLYSLVLLVLSVRHAYSIYSYAMERKWQGPHAVTHHDQVASDVCKRVRYSLSSSNYNVIPSWISSCLVSTHSGFPAHPLCSFPVTPMLWSMCQSFVVPVCVFSCASMTSILTHGPSAYPVHLHLPT